MHLSCDMNLIYKKMQLEEGFLIQIWRILSEGIG